VLLIERIDSGPQQRLRRGDLFPSLSHRDHVNRAQTHIVPGALEEEPENPRPAAVGSDLHIQIRAGRVDAGFPHRVDRLDGLGD